ncbi:hypothetical protein [Hymenobacter swuensis]|uniref:Lipoprotein n=1 Tax=Hymenobacter swuensis DY53 TaxID=1227739 RepID=W8EYS9_9BACT|nr:hypothetical protein [Hymenobacter swuensis]AHJ97763.1 hypothetical protein Hsw_2168 [Hymenobacter swuensis DY53]
MKKSYSVYSSVLGKVPGWLMPGLLLAAAAGCQNETEVLPNEGPAYYPLEVGAYRIYDVADTSWRNNVPTASRFQFREQVEAELSPDATGQPVYRIVRSRRATATDAWAMDSVLTVTVGAQHLTEQRNNRRSVELVFPVREDKVWNINAFNAQDTIIAENRFYRNVGQPFSITRGGKVYSFDNTVTTINDVAVEVNAAYTTILRTTFAKGTGPVYRVRRRFFHCDNTGALGCNPSLNYQGQSRSEVLIESGK